MFRTWWDLNGYWIKLSRGFYCILETEEKNKCVMRFFLFLKKIIGPNINCCKWLNKILKEIKLKRLENFQKFSGNFSRVYFIQKIMWSNIQHFLKISKNNQNFLSLKNIKKMIQKTTDNKLTNNRNLRLNKNYSFSNKKIR